VVSQHGVQDTEKPCHLRRLPSKNPQEALLAGAILWGSRVCSQSYCEAARGIDNGQNYTSRAVLTRVGLCQAPLVQ
jgi:hypothetical protein